MEEYEIIKGHTAPLREPTPKSAEEYARFIIKCATRTLTERHEIANQFGWKVSEVKDEIFYAEYQKRRALILFPMEYKAIEKREDSINIPEVDRAEVNFSKLTGLALKEPSISYSDLTNFLTQLNSQARTVDLNLTDTREPAKEPETAS